MTQTNAHLFDGLHNIDAVIAEKKSASYKHLTLLLLNAFIAVLVFLSLRQIPSDRLAWGWRLAYDFPSVRQIMPLNVFQRFKSTLHFRVPLPLMIRTMMHATSFADS